MKDYNTLILSGGGVKGFGIIGTLQYLKNEEKLKNIKKIIGTSVGSIIGYLLILGFDPSDIIIECIKKNYFSEMKPVQILRGLRGNGFLDYKLFENILYDFTIEKFEKIPNFEDLYKYNSINFEIVTYNYSKNREEILSKETTPDLSLFDALRMTSNIPFIFGHFQYKNDYYFDGFITSNFPIHLIKKEDISLGICCLKNNWREDKDVRPLKVIWNLFILPFFKIQYLRNEPFLPFCDVITLAFDELSMLDFTISSKTILDMFSVGYSKTQEFFFEKIKN